jgi:hypothetical protein
MQYTQEYSYFLILSLSIFINIWLLLETPHNIYINTEIYKN